LLSIGAAAPIDNKKLLFHIGKGGAADREAFADFLDEASLILDRPELKEVSLKFRASAMAWEALAKALLPDDVSQFREARDLMERRHHTFLESGGAALQEMEEIDNRLKRIRTDVGEDFPLDEAGVAKMRARLAEKILEICDIEIDAVGVLQEILIA
jgi:hypothetical protein